MSTFSVVEQVSEPFGGESIGIDRVSARAFTIPTVQPESDGTLEWKSTTLVAVELRAGGVTAFGYSYTDAAAATLINGALRPLLDGANVVEHPRLLRECLERVRNLGQGGTVAMAISAVDAALWDLKGRLLGLPVAAMLGVARPEVEVYGSGGFTSLSTDGLVEQLTGWTEQGIRRVKM
ncbi:MAG: mandelate racemase, partial [Myxococcaceae bacterium]